MIGLIIPHSLRGSAWASSATAAAVGGYSLLAVLVYVDDEHQGASMQAWRRRRSRPE
jgi:hypothetical protein